VAGGKIIYGSLVSEGAACKDFSVEDEKNPEICKLANGMKRSYKMSDDGKKQGSECGCEEGKVPNKEGRCVMPEVTFPAFVMSLNTSALYHLGEIADPGSGKRIVELDLARHAIDTLTLIQSKTKGNLTEDEAELLKNILYDIKMRFVKAAKK
jgi:hypothetical protein